MRDHVVRDFQLDGLACGGGDGFVKLLCDVGNGIAELQRHFQAAVFFGNAFYGFFAAERALGGGDKDLFYL